MSEQVKHATIPWENSFRYDLALIGVVLIALAFGWALKTRVENQAYTTANLDRNLVISYPSTWSLQAEKSTLLTISDLRGASGAQALLSVAARDIGETPTRSLAEAATSFTLERTESQTAFRVIDTEDVTVGGQEGKAVTFAYVAETQAAAFQPGPPVVMRGTAIMVIYEQTLYTFELTAEAQAYTSRLPILHSVLASARFAAAE